MPIPEKIFVSIIVPVYNEEKTIGEIIKRIKNVKYSKNFEIIVVNDGSTDNTAKILQSIDGIKILNNKINLGKGFSLRKAFGQARGEILIIQDADLEYNPKEHLKLLDQFKDLSVNVVFGSRFKNKNHHPRYYLLYWGNLLLSFLTRILYFQNISDMETCYKVFRKKVLKDIQLKCNRFDFEPEFTCKLIKNGYKIYEIPISYQSRSYGEGKKIKFSDGLRAIFILFKLRFSN
ncbi:MAG TPA: glycosyltransferase family 2 protein [Patescibacteria group bacterium]